MVRCVLGEHRVGWGHKLIFPCLPLHRFLLIFVHLTFFLVLVSGSRCGRPKNRLFQKGKKGNTAADRETCVPDDKQR
jgi:hypothetical protein